MPYIGSLIAAAFPLTLALAVDPGWSMLVSTLALFLIAEPLVGQVIEPMLYGRSTGLSPIAVVVSATFWTALWGPIGLVLSTPLTVCLVVLGRHVERLSFLDVMFGDRPALSPAEIFYQRMLAGDPTEAAEVAEEFLKERSLSAYMEDVALKGLLLAKSDLDRGALDRDRMERIRQTVQALCEDFDDLEDRVPTTGQSTSDSEAAAALDSIPKEKFPQESAILDRTTLPFPWNKDRSILCIGGNTALDDATAILFARLLSAHGLSVGLELANPEKRTLQSDPPHDCALVCLNYLGSVGPAQLRFAVRQLSRKFPAATILVGCWSFEDKQDARTSGPSPYQMVRSFRAGTIFCVEQAQAIGKAASAERPAIPQPVTVAEAS